MPVEDKDDSINKAFEDLGLDNFNFDTLFDSQNNTDNGLEQILENFIGDWEESDEIRPEIWYVSNFFCQITTFIKVRVAFVFELQTLQLNDFTNTFQLKGLKLKNKGRTNFYECCDLTKKVYLMYLYLY